MNRPAYFNLMTFDKEKVLILSPKGGKVELTKDQCKKAKIRRLKTVFRILWKEFDSGFLKGFKDSANVELTKDEMAEILRIA